MTCSVGASTTAKSLSRLSCNVPPELVNPSSVKSRSTGLLGRVGLGALLATEIVAV